MTGITMDEWGGKNFADIWPRSEELGITDQFRQVIETGKACHLENISYQDDRIAGTYRIQAFPLPDRRLAISFEDISVQQRMHRELEASEKRYRTLFETMAQGVVYQDGEGRIISANPAAERILGLTAEQMQGVTSMAPHWQAVDEQGKPLPGDAHPGHGCPAYR
jgi:two-component system, chemotaxis family, CheB/CheR fusion protein